MSSEIKQSYKSLAFLSHMCHLYDKGQRCLINIFFLLCFFCQLNSYNLLFVIFVGQNNVLIVFMLLLQLNCFIIVLDFLI